MVIRRWCAGAVAGLGRCAAVAALALAGQAARSAMPDTGALPAAVRQALAQAQVPEQAMAAVVLPLDGAAPLLAWSAGKAMNPASVFKLVTTQAALEILGPAYVWTTPVWLHGTLADGVLDGALVIKGQGDPKWTVERLWLLLRRLRQMGLAEIRGDIVIDRSAFAAPEAAPGDFDGEPLRPYNVAPDALLLAQRSLVYSFTPLPARGVALVSVEPVLDGMAVDAEVPLSAGPCEDWRSALKATPADPLRMRFEGSYPRACGEQSWPLAYADPASFDARLVKALWRSLGGQLGGVVRDGASPSTPASLVLSSAPLPELVRDINKYSNNVMAQQLFLSLGLSQRGLGSSDNARRVLAGWLHESFGALADAAVVDNGSGLSRSQRLSAELLARLLLRAWHSATMPELLASLPVAGLDGTLRRSRSSVGRAHLKTGSLRDVAATAGYVLAADGQRRILVAIIQHPQANAARPALEALLQWAGNPPGQTSAAAASTAAASGSTSGPANPTTRRQKR